MTANREAMANEREWTIAYVGQQMAIFDKHPHFMPLGLVIQTVNYNAFGGVIRAELLRLARIVAYFELHAPPTPDDWHAMCARAEKAEAELAEAQNTIAAQQGTMGALKRKLALAEGELAALKARIAKAPAAVVQGAPGAIKASFHGYGCFEYAAENLQSKLRGKRVRLLVEE